MLAVEISNELPNLGKQYADRSYLLN